MIPCEVCGVERVDDKMLLRDGKSFCDSECYQSYYTVRGINLAGGGVSNFIQLLDVPQSYLGQADKILKVNTAETGLEFAIPSGGGLETDPIFTAWDKDYADLTNKPDLSSLHTHTNKTQLDLITIGNHDVSAHAPSNAQKNSDITKEEIEAKLTGVISTHSHAGESGSGQLLVPIVSDAAAVTWTNMPLALTFWNGSHRHIIKVDLINYTQCRLVVNKQTTAGAAASKLILRYRTVFSTTVGDYSDIGSTEVSVAVNTTNNILTTNWIDLATGAKADIFLSLVGSGGDGILDPAFGQIFAQFR
jgi:hypothetical protein